MGACFQVDKEKHLRLILLRLRLGLLLLVLFSSGIDVASAQTYVDIHDFGGTITNANGQSGPDGQLSYSNVTFDSFGNMYGTTFVGGPYGENGGMVWEITKSGTYLDLHDFGGNITNANGATGPDGHSPNPGVAIDSSGKLYGTTSGGGANYGGTVWEITSSGQYFDLHDFGGIVTNADGTTGPDGLAPNGGICFDSSGNLFGTTISGGPNNTDGIVWEITASDAYLDRHDFGGTITNANGNIGPDGIQPQSGVTFDSSGNMFGTASNGGSFPNRQGMIWEITTAGVYLDLHDFGGTTTNANGSTGLDGQFPTCNVTFDSNGNMFGTTVAGGAYGAAYGGYGTIWEITSGGVYFDRHDFGGIATRSDGTVGPDGQYSNGSVAFDSFGNMFGVTGAGGQYGGSNAQGIVWELTKTGSYVNLHDFGGSVINADGSVGPDGTEPYSGVTFDPSGNMFGTTYNAGPNPGIYGIGSGIIWEIPLGANSVTLSLNSLVGGNNTKGTVTLSGPAGVGGTAVALSSNNPAVVVPQSVTVIKGAFSAVFPVSTTGVDSTVTATITAKIGNSSKTATITIKPAGMLNFVVSPQTVVGGLQSTGTINLNGQAGPNGISIALSSNSALATVPTSCNVAAGGTSGNFPIQTSSVASTTTAILAATYGVTTHNSVTLTPGGLQGVSVTPSTVIGGNGSTGTVTLTGPAPTGGTTVSLSSNNSSVIVPSTVPVIQGALTATFPITTNGVDSSTPVIVTATLGSTNRSATLTVTPARMLNFLVSPGSVTGGSQALGTVNLNGQAGPSGIAVTVSSNNANATVPGAFTIQAFATSGNFNIDTNVVTSPTTAVFTVICGVTTHNSLTMTPGGLVKVSVSPSSVVGGKGSTGTVTISGPAPSTGTTVLLSSSSSSVTVPISVFVPNGAVSAPFPITTIGVDTAVACTISATLGETTRTTALTVNPAAMLNFVVSPSSVTGGTQAIGTVNLNGQAGPSGILVTIQSNNSHASVPISFTIPAFAVSGTFPITTTSVAATVTAIFAVTYGVTTHNSLIITP